MRSLAPILLLIVFLSAHSLQPINGIIGTCCEYAFIVSDTQPKPGERVDFTGAVTDLFGGGEPNVQIQYEDLNEYIIANATTDSAGGFRLSTTIPNPGYPNSIGFIITMTDNAIRWSQAVSDSFSSPLTSPSGDFPALYDSQVNGRANSYINIQSPGAYPGVIYLSGGYKQPVLEGVSVLDQATTDFLGSLAEAGFNVVAPIGWFAANTPNFPYVLATMLKYGFHIRQVYLIGWSAGGTAAAWVLIHDAYALFNLGVIMDAELDGTQNQSQTSASVFSTVNDAATVTIPHLLIWGETEAGTTSIQSAMLWVMKAKEGLARLDAFPYSHQWIGSAAESEVFEDIVGFFDQQNVGTLNRLQSGNVTFRILTNSQFELANHVYDPNAKTFTFQLAGESGTTGSLNVVIPKSSINGQPVVLFNNSVVDMTYSSDSVNYYIYVTYSQSSHAVVIGGQNSVPEFAIDSRSWLMTFLISFVVLAAFQRRLARRKDNRAYMD